MAVLKKNYGTVKTEDELDAFVDRLVAAGKPIGFDIEAGYTGKDKKGKVALKQFHPEYIMTGFSFTNSTDWARYAAVAHDNGPNLDKVRAARSLWKMLQSGLAVIHNASYELQGAGRFFRDTLWDDPFFGKQVREANGYFPFLSDTMIEAAMVQQYPYVGLKKLTKLVFGHQMMTIESLFPELPKAKMQYLRFNTRELLPAVVEYACEDAVWCLALHQKHYPIVKDKMMFQAEMQLLPILAQMEFDGLNLDWASYANRERDTEQLIEGMNEEIQQELSSRVGRVVNINLGSPPQVAQMLYEELGLPIKERTEKGAPSTGESALRAIAKKDRVIEQILQYREVKKLQGSYITKYLGDSIRYAEDDRAHPNHNQLGAATGRFSVDGVSYQQWPKPYHFELNSGLTYDLNYRDFLIAPDEWRIVGYDYANVELRVLAGMSEETNMIAAFNSGADFHKQTAATMFKCALEEVTDKMRSAGKTISFATVYGSGAQNIADLLGITKEEAQQFLDQYFEAFPKLKAWMNKMIMQGKRDGYVQTHFGRRYKLWDFLEIEQWKQKKGERMCVNAPVQGTGADIIKLAMIRAQRALKKAGLDRKVILFMTIHDALEFYVHESVDTQTVIDILNPAVVLNIPGFPEIRADWHEGVKWGSVVEIELDDEKKISQYKFKVEQPGKQKQTFTGFSFPEVWDGYTGWLSENQLDEKNVVKGKQEDAVVDNLQEALEHVMEDIDVEPVKDVVITIKDMPDPQSWSNFQRYVKAHPGQGKVTVETPEGDIQLSGEYSLDESNQGEISMILNGAALRLTTPLELVEA